MTTTSKLTITKISGVAYVAAISDGNLGASANVPTVLVPAGAAYPNKGVERPRLRLVR